MGCSKKTPQQTSGPTDQIIKGVWLTNVASTALDSKENIVEAVTKCHKLGFNTIYMVVWNKNRTMFRSSVVEKITGELIDPIYGNRDPLQEVLEAAKPLGIKVIAWFEFGFASAHGDASGGLLIRKNPDWASRDINGKITEKNNFYWLNAFHPEVQKFMIELISEVVQNYDVDGIQGDDRLPALPSNGGYDAYTVSLYKADHDGQLPPDDYLDEDWIHWRADRLTDFLANLSSHLKAIDPDLIISMAPSIYPWSKTNYLQDWPTWLERGLVDEIIPQIYRYNFKAYQHELDKIVNHQIDDQNFKSFRAGILLKVNNYIASESLLDSIINYNRSKNVQGDVYFFYEGLKSHEEYFSLIYSN